MLLTLLGCPRGELGSRGPEVVDLAMARTTACALYSTGSVRCWGEVLGQSGGETSLRPVPLLEVHHLGAGPTAACAGTDASLHCWGRWSAIGTGPGDDKAAPGWALPLAHTRQVALGERHGCAIDGEGEVWCWGRSPSVAEAGVLGTGAHQSTEPLHVPLGGQVVDLDAGFAHTCALRQDGAVFCWGDAACGQLGDGSLEDSPTPVRAGSWPGARDLTTGASHSCVLDAQGQAWCWGCVSELGVEDAQLVGLGLSGATRRVSPVASPTAGSHRFRTLVSSQGGTLCGISTDDRVHCWGDNTVGQLGQGEGPARSAPVQVQVQGARLLEAGEEAVCAVDGQGAVICWGLDREGLLGDTSPGRVLGPRVMLAPPG